MAGVHPEARGGTSAPHSSTCTTAVAGPPLCTQDEENRVPLTSHQTLHLALCLNVQCQSSIISSSLTLPPLPTSLNLTAVDRTEARWRDSLLPTRKLGGVSRLQSGHASHGGSYSHTTREHQEQQRRQDMGLSRQGISIRCQVILRNVKSRTLLQAYLILHQKNVIRSKYRRSPPHSAAVQVAVRHGASF